MSFSEFVSLKVKTMSDITKDDVRDRLGNIDQIRDIIFGSQLRENDNRFSKIESDVVYVQQDLRDRIEHLKTHLETELRSGLEALEKKLRSTQASLQEEETETRQQIDRMNKKFTASLQQFDEAVYRQFGAIRTEMTEAKTKIQEDTSSLREFVLEELERRFSQLHEGKVSRDDMAETLFELGMRLKGTEFIPSLREASENGHELETVPLLATRTHVEDQAN
jgi:DNA anti-recombination protein RmuC